MKLLVGRQFDDPAVQEELLTVPFKTEKLAGGGVGISVTYNDAPLLVSAEHVMAMMIVKGMDISKNANGNLSIGDAVLAVPHWFTENQRRGVVHACDIAGLNCLKVANESALIALSYGIFKSAKKLFSETEPQHIMFIDIGFTGYSVSVVSFIQENMNILSTVCDRSLGGRNFDDIIMEYCAEVFEAKTKINVRGNKKAMLKVQAAAEKAKKTLSPNGVKEVINPLLLLSFYHILLLHYCLLIIFSYSITVFSGEYQRRVPSRRSRYECFIDQGRIREALCTSGSAPEGACGGCLGRGGHN
jgi:heat shock protein 4